MIPAAILPSPALLELTPQALAHSLAQDLCRLLDSGEPPDLWLDEAIELAERLTVCTSNL